MEAPIIYEGKFHYRITAGLIVLIALMALPAGAVKIGIGLFEASAGKIEPLSKLSLLFSCSLPILLVLLAIVLHARHYMKRKLMLLPEEIFWKFPNGLGNQFIELHIPLDAVQEVYAVSDRTLMITANGTQYAVDGLVNAFTFAQAVHSRISDRVQEKLIRTAADAARQNAERQPAVQTHTDAAAPEKNAPAEI